ncbi:GntR family transcriptional regulator [Actinomadura barringtoniae]|uniref:GntR family transcriptional regulator n=1 Tax=Actinomadura barringtoniae TaxID=1427535 RepID=A0A939PF66_9ACTN|nr:GntR family transcriptional regulator [Actinomadura barringtoniae]MBO2448998.1 GntR family transcriptional regulator [Actinomadura barringtoniae]
MRLRATSLVDALVAELRDRMLDGRLPGGTALTETEVAGEYEVARPTAKAAIERLVSEGLLRRDAHKSARVPVFEADDVADLYFARSLLERQVVRELSRISLVPAAAYSAQDEIRRLGESAASTTAIVEPDVRFHRTLVDALESPRLSRIHEAMMAEMRLCMAQVQAHELLRVSEIADEHQAILDAITAGDPPRAEQALDLHLTRARHQLLTHLP